MPTTEHHERYTRFMAPMVAMFAVIFATLQPMLPYIDLNNFRVSGIYFATALMAVFEGFRGDRTARIFYWFALVPAAAGSYYLIPEFGKAPKRYEENQVRCAAIAKDMLSTAPKLTDGPALFQALSCQPFTAISSPNILEAKPASPASSNNPINPPTSAPHPPVRPGSSG